MNKFNRNYSLLVQTNAPATEFITIQPPFTLEFDIIRNQLSSANTSSFRIYNLSKETRNSILKDKFDFTDVRKITLRAGYGDIVTNFPIIFNGNVSRAWSVREGTDFVTQIESFDSGDAFTNAKVNIQFPSGVTQQSVIQTLAQSLTSFDVQVGAIGTFPGTLSRGNSYSGNPIDILSQLTNGGFFIDNQIANCLRQDEAISVPEIPVINSDSGLLGTPVREETYLNFEILFEPQLRIGQLVKLESTTGSNYSGYYSVVSLQHRGTISEAVCGNAITRVGVFAGTKNFTQVQSAS